MSLERNGKEKAGDTISVTLEYIDGDRKILSRTVQEWYGFDNADGNARTLQLVRGVTDTAGEWAKEKAERDGNA
jgi:hypothetical protein